MFSAGYVMFGARWASAIQEVLHQHVHPGPQQQHCPWQGVSHREQPAVQDQPS